MKKFILMMILLLFGSCGGNRDNIDLDPPQIPIVYGVEENGYYEKEVVIKIEKESDVTYELFINDTLYKEGTPYKNDGKKNLKILAKKNSNNLIIKKEVNFTINSSTPLPPMINGVTNNGIFPTGTIITLKEIIGQKTDVYLNNTLYQIGTPITNDGNYKLELISTNLSNKKTVKKTINFTLVHSSFPMPQIVGVVDGYIYNKEVFIDIDNRVEEITYKLTINGKEHDFKKSYKSEGVNKVVITGMDKLGTKLLTSLVFIQDFSGPSIPSITGVAEGEYYKRATINFNNELGTNYIATLNGNPYIPNTPIKKEGKYTFKVEAIKNGKSISNSVNFFISKKDFIIKSYFDNEELIAIFTNQDANKKRSKSEDRIVINSNINTNSVVINKVEGNIEYIDFQSSFVPKKHVVNNRFSPNMISTSISSSKIGDKRNFNVLSLNADNRKNTNQYIDFELITLNYDKEEKRQINIWVDSKNKDSLPKEKAQYLADKFLKEDTKEDIYAWLTNIFGKEWVDRNETLSGYSFIKGTGEIDILLYKMNSVDSSRGKYLGYFSPKDNYKKIYSDNSNESIMFYLDLEAYLTKNGRNIITSTLVHEFYHMINFYQKNVLRTNRAYIDSWLNEMLALISEDLLSHKLGIPGPRGVVGAHNVARGLAYGRLAELNGYNSFDVNDSDGSFEIIDYSIAYAYGAYLLRNYANQDLTFLRDIVHNDKLSFDAIEYSLKKHGYTNVTFEDTVRDWGIASMISDNVYKGSKKYHYNNKVTPKLNNIEYPLGPVNLFNYYIKPTLYGTNQNQSPILSGGANIYYKLGKNLIGYNEFSGNLPKGVDISLVLKDNINGFNEVKSNLLQKSIIFVND